MSGLDSDCENRQNGSTANIVDKIVKALAGKTKVGEIAEAISSLSGSLMLIASHGVLAFTIVCNSVEKQTGVNILDALLRCRVLESIPFTGIDLSALIDSEAIDQDEKPEVGKAVDWLLTQEYITQTNSWIERTPTGDDQLE